MMNRLCLISIVWMVLFLGCTVDNSQEVNIKPTSEPIYKKLNSPLFSKQEDADRLYQDHEKRHAWQGNQDKQKFYNKPMTRGAKIPKIQFSSRKRLYDYNLILRAVYAGRIVHQVDGNFQNRLNKALFFDLGSAILMGEGAPTVRDIYEDKQIYPHLSKIVASDINDPSSPKRHYVDIYRREKNNLPFLVQEIPMAIVKPEQVTEFTRKYVTDEKSPVIFRTVNTGIDYYYPLAQLKEHFQAVAIAFTDRDFLYLFNRFILWKKAGSQTYEIIGEIDNLLFQAETGVLWPKINWQKRKVEKSFMFKSPLITILPVGVNK